MVYQWNFGYGLSYSSFKYTELKLDKKFYTQSDTLNIEVTVTNDSDIEGSEVVQVFCSDLVASVTPSVKRLRGFEKIKLKPNESKRVKLDIPVKELAFVGIENEWILESGDFTLSVGDLKTNFSVNE